MATLPAATGAAPNTAGPATAMAAAAAGPPSPVLPSTNARAQTLQLILDFYMNKFDDLHQRMATVEMAMLTKGKSMEMEAQSTDFEAQDAARHTLASGAAGAAVEAAAEIPQDGWSHPKARLLRIKDSLAERQNAVMDHIVAISACYGPVPDG
jgi:hypothetical protein